MNNSALLAQYCYAVQISRKGRIVIVAADDQEAMEKASSFGSVVHIQMMHPTRLHRDRRKSTDEALYRSIVVGILLD